MSKFDFKPRLIRWMLLLQEFDVKIKVKKGLENLIANHLSQLINKEITSQEKEILGKKFIWATTHGEGKAMVCIRGIHVTCFGFF